MGALARAALEAGGHVTGIIPEFLTERESAHLVYRARVVLEDAPHDLRPGLAARVELVMNQ